MSAILLGKPFTPTYHHKPYPAIDPTRPELSAKDKVVVITGGGQGIGRATARSFAKANAKAIVIIGRTERSLLDTKAEIEQITGLTTVRVHVGDVTNETAIQNIFASVKQEFGEIDVLVSNAGYLPTLGPIASEDPDDVWKAFEINVKGAFNVVRAFLGAASPNATIINVSSGVVHLTLPGSQAYSTSKAAVLTWLGFVQGENESMRVVSVHPGVIESAMSIKSGTPAEDDGKFKYFSSLYTISHSS